MRRRAIFLDRDDTIVEDAGYASSPEQMKLFPGTGEAIAEYRRRGYMVVLVTNQSGIGRGYFTDADLRAMHDRIQEDLARSDARIDAIYYCPHLPPDAPESGPHCDCRKPLPGMLLRASQDHHIDLDASYMVGNSASDIQAGQAAGCRTVLVSWHGEPKDDAGADVVVRSLLELLPHLDADA